MSRASQSPFEQALAKVYPLIRKTSFELYSANQNWLPEMLPEDYSQDINLELFNFSKKLTPEQENLDDMVPLFIHRIKLEKLHFLANANTYSKSRTRHHISVSDYRSSGSLQEDSLTPAEVFEAKIYETLGADDLIFELEEHNPDAMLLREIKKWEKTAPGVTRFVQESLHPSQETLQKFEDYKTSMISQNKVLRRMNGNTIPPVVLMELIGDNRNRISSFKRVISFAMSDIGITKERIIKEWKLAELYFTNRQAV